MESERSQIAKDIVFAATGAARQVGALAGRLAGVAVLVIAVLVFFQSLMLLSLPSEGFQLELNLFLQFVLLCFFYGWSVSRSDSYVNAPAILACTLFLWHSGLLFGHFVLRADSFDYTGNVLSIGRRFLPEASALVALCLSLVAVSSLLGYRTVVGSCASQGGIFDSEAPYTSIVSRDTVMYRSQLPQYLLAMFLAIIIVYFSVDGIRRMGVPYLSLYLETSESWFDRVYHGVQYLGVPLLFLSCSLARSKRALVFAFGSGVTLVFVGMMLGSRSVPFLYALTLIVCFDAYVRRIPVYAIVLLFLLGSAGSFIIDHSRQFGIGLGVLDVDRVQQPINLFHIFWNTGGVFKTLLRTMEFAQETGLMYGRSIVDAITTLIPTPLLDFVGLRHELFRPSEWLVENSPDVEKGGGLGYSLIAESYLNFGYFGVALFFLLGWFVSHSYFLTQSGRSMFAGLYGYTLAVLLALHMRNDVAAYFRVAVYSFLVILIIQMLVKRHAGRLQSSGIA